MFFVLPLDTLFCKQVPSGMWLTWRTSFTRHALAGWRTCFYVLAAALRRVVLGKAVQAGESACNSVWSWQQEVPRRRKGCLPSHLSCHNVAYCYRACIKQLFCLTWCYTVRVCFAGRPYPQLLCIRILHLFILLLSEIRLSGLPSSLLVAMVTFMVRVFAHEIKS